MESFMVPFARPWPKTWLGPRQALPILSGYRVYPFITLIRL